MSTPVRIGIIGVRGYGSTYFSTLSGNNDARIIALCDMDLKHAKALAEQYEVPFVCSDYKELIGREDVDAVFIATPHFLHHEMAMAALAAGKHVFCEKPLAITIEHAREMAETAERLGLKLSCHYNRRQSAHVKLLKDRIEKGDIGDIYTINLKWMARYTSFLFDPNSGWRIDKEKAGGGILIGRGSHMLDAALYLLDYPSVKSVNASVSNRLAGLDVDDYSLVTIRLADGGVITLECAYLAHLPHYKEKIEYEVLGTKSGAYCLEQDGKGSFYMGSCRYPQNQWTDTGNGYDPNQYESWYPTSIIADFIDSIVNDREPLVTGWQAALITGLLESSYRSAEEGREIPIL